ncbi:hypothetical protein APUTEX25_000122 [Auxenochlorella protothecoides]|uniref:Uncharacterized protein n=2 Tax=Auxenochlorella protothecoides TaxID=3075 RepID=A0A3M7L038_AUXPR|nr:hypothetical protein APUTEX25_000122 [Auxenochlorella protothecoides]|eukprot:RMZ55539.1 hypothetical protein APUTEX25_000122 [Auxenochlorella protothecoides]
MLAAPFTSRCPTHKTASTEVLLSRVVKIVPDLREGLAWHRDGKPFRKLRHQAYVGRERAITRLAEQFRAPPGTTTIVGVGNWSAQDRGGTMRGPPPGPWIRFLRRLRRVCRVVVVDEHRSSKLCCACHATLHAHQYVRVRNGEEKLMDVWDTKRCTNKAYKVNVVNRDVNGAANILMLAKAPGLTRHSYHAKVQTPGRSLGGHARPGPGSHCRAPAAAAAATDVPPTADAQRSERTFDIPGARVRVEVVTRAPCGTQAITVATDKPGSLLLHWGVEGGAGYEGGWRLPGPGARPPRTVQYKQRALQTRFSPAADGGQAVSIELPGPEASDRLNFVIKNEGMGEWYDLNGANFQVQLRDGGGGGAAAPAGDVRPALLPADAVPNLPQELCGVWAYLAWERAGCPARSGAEADAEYDAGVAELVLLLRRGVGLDELWAVARGQVPWAQFQAALGGAVSGEDAAAGRAEGAPSPPAPAPPAPAVPEHLVGTQAYLLWEAAGKPDGADFGADARRVLREQLAAGRSVQELEHALGASPPEASQTASQTGAPPASAPAPAQTSEESGLGASRGMRSVDPLDLIKRPAAAPLLADARPGAQDSPLAPLVRAAGEDDAVCWHRLTWQRNYNTQPRILGAAQERLTHTIAKVYSKTSGMSQEWARLLLTTVGRGGNAQAVRDDILHIMHRNHIPEKGGTWMEQWHQKLHNNTTPDDVPICEAYLAFLESGGDQALSDRVVTTLGPLGAALGAAFGAEDWTVRLFAEEVVRAGPAFALSLALSAAEPGLRAAAELGAWQLVSPGAARGELVAVPSLREVQDRAFPRPTVLLAWEVTGEEEVPAGVVALLSPDAPDVLSHLAVRARNLAVLFAACHDAAPLRELEALEGRVLELDSTAAGAVTWQEADEEEVEGGGGRATPAGVAAGTKKLTRPTTPKWCGKWVLGMDEFKQGVVGAKSNNLAGLRGRLPESIQLPASVTIPFGSFEKALESRENRELAKQIRAAVSSVTPHSPGPALARCRDLVNQVAVPSALRKELEAGMRAAGIPVPQNEERWEAALCALKAVWASKYNDRAFYSCRKVGLRFDDVRMAVLCQRVVPVRYAFVIHTANPVSGDADEIYAELVIGLGEAIVSGAVPGSALAFSARKDALDAPRVLLYPSKSRALVVADSLILRSDSNGEDLEGYAGAGLYESVTVDATRSVVADYSADDLLMDPGFRRRLMTDVCRVGLEIEQALGSAQDIEGVVGKDGAITVVQTRPQV